MRLMSSSTTSGSAALRYVTPFATLDDENTLLSGTNNTENEYGVEYGSKYVRLLYHEKTSPSLIPVNEAIFYAQVVVMAISELVHSPSSDSLRAPRFQDVLTSYLDPSFPVESPSPLPSSSPAPTSLQSSETPVREPPVHNIILPKYKNVCNSCYASVIFWMMLSSPSLRKSIQNAYENNEYITVPQELELLYTSSIQRQPIVISLQVIIDKYSILTLDGINIQSDPDEFFNLILGTLESTTRLKATRQIDSSSELAGNVDKEWNMRIGENYSTIKANLYFSEIITKEMKLKTGSGVNHYDIKPEISHIVQLSFDQTIDRDSLSIGVLLNRNYTEDEVDVVSHPTHGNGKQNSMITKTSLWSIPRVLILLIKRSTTMNRTHSKNVNNIPITVKLEHRILLDEELNLKPFLHNDSPFKNNECKYALRSIVCHKGGQENSGHYTCIANINGDWLEYDDTKTMKNGQEWPKRVKITDEYVQKGCYMLLYESTEPENLNPANGVQMITEVGNTKLLPKILPPITAVSV